jgi:hypothetical protein
MGEPVAIAAPSSRACITLGLNLHLLDERSRQSEYLFRNIESSLGIPYFHREESSKSADEISEFLDSLFSHAKLTQRMCLLVAGGLLDEHISTLVLASLQRGLDVYLLHDCLACGQRKFEHVFTQRLHQAGAIPTTLGQCLFHWELEAQNESQRTKIVEFSRELSEIVS